MNERLFSGDDVMGIVRGALDDVLGPTAKPARTRTAMPRPLTVGQVAELLGVHVNTVKRIPPAELPYFVVASRGDRRYEAVSVQRYKRHRTVDR